MATLEYEAAVQREMLDMAARHRATLEALRDNINAIGGYAADDFEKGINHAVIRAVVMIEDAIASVGEKT